jgi:hypothetical protein
MNVIGLIFWQVIDAYTSNILQPRFRDSRFLCPSFYSFTASDYNAERYENPISQMFLREIGNIIFSYDKVHYSSLLNHCRSEIQLKCTEIHKNYSTNFHDHCRSLCHFISNEVRKYNIG